MMMPRLHRGVGPGVFHGRGMGVVVWGVALVVGQALSGQVAAADSVSYMVFPAVPSAAPSERAQPTGREVTLVVRDSTIKYVVNELARRAHLQPTYVDSPVLARRISLRVVRSDVMDAFALALRGTGLEAKMAADGETVVIRTRSGATVGERSPAGGVVVGRVMDSTTGAGLNGAQVRVEGVPKLSTVTSDSGHFTLRNVPSGDQLLQVRLFGYRPVIRTVTVVDGERTTVRIAMAAVPTVLSGVITTATGSRKKVEVGNDITTLNVDSIMQVAPVASVTDLMESRVPGLTVLHSDGVPGDPSRLRLRGAGSLQFNNDPVVVIDGVRVYASQSDSRNNNLAPNAPTTFVNGSISRGNQNASGGFAAPSPLDQIDQNSIASIEVLKGPSATAVYGSDAASGVIVITTKHGRAGPTHWSLTLQDGVNWLPGAWPKNYYAFGHYPDLQNGAGQVFCQPLTLNCTVDSLVAFQALDDPRYTVFSHGNNQQASLTVSGGGPTMTYSLTGSGSGDLGNLKLPKIEEQRYDSAYGPIPNDLIRPDRLTTWGVAGQLSVYPSPTLQVTIQSSLHNSDQQQSSLSGAIPQISGEYINSVFLAVNPLIINEYTRAKDNALSSTDVLSLQWRLRPWLPLNMTGGLNVIQRDDEQYLPYGVPPEGVGVCGVTIQICADTTGFYGLGRGTSRDQTLTVGTEIPLPHVQMAVGGNLNAVSTADVIASTNQLAPGVSTPTSFPTTLVNGIVPSTISQSTSAQTTYGWYVEPRLNFASRFFVAPGFRLDGGSGGSSTTNSGVGGLSAFPKIDLSYLAVDRQTARPLWGFLTQLRPRFAFGIAGTQPGPADKLRLFNVGANYKLTPPGEGSLTLGLFGCNSTVFLNGVDVPAVCLNALGNTQLHPERSVELEGGADATLWQGRLSVTYTQYNKTRRDAILSIPVAPSVSGTGLGGAYIEKNVGVIRNTGSEMTIDAMVFQHQTVSWHVGANLSNDNNLVVRLNAGQPPIVLNSGQAGDSQERVTAGYPLFGEWALPIASVIDANHDGIIEPNEIRYGDSAVYVGQPNPKYQFNLFTDLTLLSGRLSLHATFAYQNGLTQDNQGACNSGAFALLPNTPNTSLATQAAVVAAGCSGGVVAVTGIGLVQTVNTFRFQDLSINYTVPRRVASWFRAPVMRVALQGENLGLHTNYRGVDPNVNAFSTVSAGDETKDLGQVPQPRTWLLMLTLGN